MAGAPPRDGADHEMRQRLNRLAGFASISVASVLVALKAWALLATGALSVAASLVDSLIDLMASGAALIGIFYSARPPDDDHTFGHSSVEDLVALGQATLVTVSALAIVWKAAGRLSEPPALGAEAAGLGVMLVATGLTLLLVLWQGYVADRTGSKIVAADRLHYLSDLLPNIGAILALLAAGLGILCLDPVVAIAACLVLLWGARRIGLGAWHALMDREADPALVARIEQIVAAHAGLQGFHDLRTRTSGSRLFIQVHVELDGDLSLRDAHAIGAALRAELLRKFPDADVIIHKDPK